MNSIQTVESDLRSKPKTWIVTGVAGFVASNITDYLLDLGQKVIGIDNFSTGKKAHIERLSKKTSGNFTFFETDIRDLEKLKQIASEFPQTDYVLHQAALGSVPRSIANPLASHDNNVNGFLNILEMCKDSKFRLVYASSSSVYGDSPNLPKVEAEVGTVLSPYAATKKIDEIYADVYHKTYGVEVAGLRYFNVFGPHQNPDGAYAAVIPRWYELCLKGESPKIFGDGETTRDFCFVKNAIQANILAAVNMDPSQGAQVYNVAAEKRITLNELLEHIQSTLAELKPSYKKVEAEYSDFRAGDIRHSLADVSKAKTNLGYKPQYSSVEGIKELSSWYVQSLSAQ